MEHIDYDDEMLVDCVYHMYEQMERGGEAYLQARFFEDVKKLERQEAPHAPAKGALPEETAGKASEADREPSHCSDVDKTERYVKNGDEKRGRDEKEERDEDIRRSGRVEQAERGEGTNKAEKSERMAKTEKKGILSIFEGRKNREKRLRESYRQAMQCSMEGYAVAEESAYGKEELHGKEPFRSFCEKEFSYDQETSCEEEEYGRTIYIEESKEGQFRRLYTPEGRLLAKLEGTAFSIGKKKGEVDLALEDASVSRIHARITLEKEEAYLEDLNATNGTFKNGLRLQPYEKRKLEYGDEIKCGKVIFVFR